MRGNSTKSRCSTSLTSHAVVLKCRPPCSVLAPISELAFSFSNNPPHRHGDVSRVECDVDLGLTMVPICCSVWRPEQDIKELGAMPLAVAHGRQTRAPAPDVQLHHEALAKGPSTPLGVAPDSRSHNPKARNKAGAEPLLGWTGRRWT